MRNFETHPYISYHSILQNLSSGKVDGVCINFSHPKLNLQTHFWAHGFQSDELVFPSQFDENGNILPVLFPGREERDGGTHLFLNRGDQVVVSDVVDFHLTENPELEDDHDCNELEVKLQVIRANGEIVALKEPEIFIARDSMRPISDYAGLDSIERPDCGFGDTYHISIEKMFIRLARIADTNSPSQWSRLAQNLKSNLQSRAFRTSTGRWQHPASIEAGAAFGYALAKFEAELNLAPRVLAQLQAEAHRKRITKLAAARRTKPETLALKADARAMCEQDRNLSLTKCSRVLADKYGRDQANVRRMIKSLFQKRQISSGRIEYRPISQGASGDSTG